MVNPPAFGDHFLLEDDIHRTADGTEGDQRHACRASNRPMANHRQREEAQRYRRRAKGDDGDPAEALVERRSG